MANAVMSLRAWHWYDDDATGGDPDTCTARGAEGTTENVLQPTDTDLQLRVSLDETSNRTGSDTLTWQYQINGTGGTWTDITTSSSYVRAIGAASSATDGNACTQLLSGVGGDSYQNGQETTDGTYSHTISGKNNFWEDQLALTLRSADLSAGDVVYIRVNVSGSGTIDLDATQNYARAIIGPIPVNAGSVVAFAPPVVEPNLIQTSFRIRSSGGQQDASGVDPNTDTGWAAAENVSVTGGYWDQEFRVRFAVAATQSQLVDGLQLWYSFNGGAYAVVPDNATPWTAATQQVRVACVASTATNYANPTTLTASYLTSSGAFVGGTGDAQAVEDNTTGTLTVEAGEYTEVEFCVLIRKGSNEDYLEDSDYFDFRVRLDDGTALDSYTVTPRVTLQGEADSNGAGHLGGCMPETPSAMVVPVGNSLYALIEPSDGTTVNPYENEPIWVKSTDGGISWTAPDIANRYNSGGEGTANDVEAIDAVLVGTTIRLLIQGTNTGSGDSVYYATWDTSTDTYGVGPVFVDETVVQTYGQAVALAYRPGDGDMFAFYQDSNGTYGRVNYKQSSDGGSTWDVTPTDLDSTTSTYSYGGFVTAVDSTGRTHIVYTELDEGGGGGWIWHKSISTSDVLSGRTAVNSAGSLTDGGSAKNKRYAHTRLRVFWEDGVEKLGVIYSRDDDLLYYTETPVSSISWSTDEVVSDTGVTVGFDGGGNEIVEADLVVDSADRMHVYFSRSDDASYDLYTDTRDGGSWGTNSSLITAVTGVRWVRADIYERSGIRYSGLLYDDHPNPGGTGAVKYLEVQLGPAAIAPTPVVVHAPAVTASTGAGGQTATVSSAPAVVRAPAVTTSVGAVSRTIAAAAMLAVAPTVSASYDQSIAADVAPCVVTAPAVTTSTGAVSRTVGVVPVVHHAPAVTVTQGAANRTVGASAWVHYAPAVTASAGAVTRTVTSAVMPVAAPAVSASPGAVSRTVGSAAQVLRAPQVSAGGTQTRTVGASTLLAVAPDVVVLRAIMHYDSSNVAAGGEATTRQLAAPSGKDNGDFIAGHLEDTENPSSSVSGGDGTKWTEMAWALKPTSLAGGTTYKFRLVRADTGQPIYQTVTPKLNVQAAGSGTHMVLHAPAVTVQAGAISRTVDAASALLAAPTATASLTTTVAVEAAVNALHAPAVTTQAGAVTRSVGSAHSAFYAPAVTVQTGAVSRTVGSAGCVWAAPSAVGSVGAISRAVGVAALTAYAPAVTVVVGAVSRTVEPGALVAYAPTLVATTGNDRAVGIAPLVAHAPSVTVVTGGVSRSINAAGLTAYAPAVTVSAGAVSRSVDASSLLAYAPTVTVVGPQSTSVGSTSLVAHAPAAIGLLEGFAAVNPAPLVAHAPAVTTTTGAASRTVDAASTLLRAPAVITTQTATRTVGSTALLAHAPSVTTSVTEDRIVGAAFLLVRAPAVTTTTGAASRTVDVAVAVLYPPTVTASQLVARSVGATSLVAHAPAVTVAAVATRSVSAAPVIWRAAGVTVTTGAITRTVGSTALVAHAPLCVGLLQFPQTETVAVASTVVVAPAIAAVIRTVPVVPPTTVDVDSTVMSVECSCTQTYIEVAATYTEVVCDSTQTYVDVDVTDTEVGVYE